MKKLLKMKELINQRNNIKKEYENKLNEIEKELYKNTNDHIHKYKIAFDSPPYDYGRVCTMRTYLLKRV